MSCHEDVLMQRMLASTGTTGDVFFIISHTGRTKEIVEIAEIARSNGSTGDRNDSLKFATGKSK